jgi:hypothetical protein
VALLMLRRPAPATHHRWSWWVLVASAAVVVVAPPSSYVLLREAQSLLDALEFERATELFSAIHTVHSNELGVHELGAASNGSRGNVPYPGALVAAASAGLVEAAEPGRAVELASWALDRLPRGGVAWQVAATRRMPGGLWRWALPQNAGGALSSARALKRTADQAGSLFCGQ